MAFPSPYGVRSFQTIRRRSVQYAGSVSVSVPLRGEVVSNQKNTLPKNPSPCSSVSVPLRGEVVSNSPKIEKHLEVTTKIVSVPLRGEVVSNP